MGRGSNRGRRDRPSDVLRTRPDHVESKKGNTGDRIPLVTNYFTMKCKTDWRLRHYTVEYAPNDEDRTWMRRKLLEQHSAQLGANLFDGASLFTPARLMAPGGQLVLTSQREDDGKMFTLTVRLVQELYYTDGHFVQFFNILMRRCLQGLELQELGRNYFDPKACIKLNDWKLELWPGYVTSIRQHEKEVRRTRSHFTLSSLTFNFEFYCKIIGSPLLRDLAQDPPHGHRPRPAPLPVQDGRGQLPEQRPEAPPRLHRHHPLQQQDIPHRRHRLQHLAQRHLPRKTRSNHKF